MGKELRICAFSDPHGQLPLPITLKEVDVTVICGDVVDLYVQRDDSRSKEWFENVFKKWTDRVGGKTIIIGGNHDFWLSRIGKEKAKEFFKETFGDNVVYLEDEAVEIDGVKFYGCPWCEGPIGWAFSPNADMSIIGVWNHYDNIPDCDVLLTHQPPMIGNVSKSNWWTAYAKDFGSDKLRTKIKERKIALSLSGHVHSGTHGKTLYPTMGCDTVFYNVSLLNERYNTYYTPMYLSIDTETKEVREIYAENGDKPNDDSLNLNKEI